MKSEAYYKKMYSELKKQGDLNDMFPFLSGYWAKDKEQFISIQENPMELLGDLNENFIDED